MKKLIRIKVLVGLFLVATVFSCNKLATVTIMGESEVSNITDSSATVTGNVIEVGEDMTEYGHVWGESANPTTTSNFSSSHSETKTLIFSDFLNDLKPETKYYLRTYAKDGDEIAYQDTLSFTTLKKKDSVDIVTFNASNINYNSASCGGNIINQGESPITMRGVCWSVTENPTTTDNKTENGTGIGNFTSSVTGLTESTTYYIRAYAVNNEGTHYGQQESFETILPGQVVLSTNDVSAITYHSAFCGGNITDEGESAVSMRGVCWSTTENPTTADNITENGSGPGSFSSSITGLSETTTYYVKAYATNEQGTSYGDQKTFTTEAVAPPVLTTDAVSSITYNSAIGGGNITDEGDFPVTERGICWSKSPNPTTSDFYTQNGSGPGSFSGTMTGLDVTTTYYVRAYAVNSQGTFYGQEETFSTIDIAPVVLTTDAVTSIDYEAAVSGGNITDEGDFPVTQRGVCWSTSENPTTSDNTTQNSSGPGTFISNLTGLTNHTTYYVRAYAITDHDTYYGQQEEFITLNKLPTVITNEATLIAYENATCGGNVTIEGIASVTQKGVCWSASTNPTINDFFTNDGSGLGSYSSLMQNLNEGETYYVRAYAINSEGTGYGQELSFTTQDFSGTVTDIDGNVYNTVQIGNQIWMAENLRVSKFKDGTQLPNITSGSEWVNTTTPAYCWYKNDSTSYEAIYGKLYNFQTTGNICPVGWHVPSRGEWNILKTFLVDSAGAKIKQVGTEFWNSPNNATNETGFTALPGGLRNHMGGAFSSMRANVEFWTKDMFALSVYIIRLDNLSIDFYEVNIRLGGGKAIRCVKD